MTSSDDQFYLILPSTSSTDLYDNTQSSFTTKLYKRINLIGEWRVALTKIYINGNICITLAPYNYIKIYYKKNTEEQKYVKIEIPDKCYKNGDELIKTLQELIDKIQFTKNNVRIYIRDGKVKIEMRVDFSIIIPEPIALIFGEPTGKGGWVLSLPPHIKEYGVASSKDVVDITRILPQFVYIYCDIITNQLVGDASAKLLKVVSIDKYKSINSIEIVEPQYLKVEKKDFESVKIDLRNTLGNLIPFEKLYDYYTIVELHLKKIK